MLGKEDVRKIKKWRNENPDLNIKEGIEMIIKLKPVTIVTHLVIVEINYLLKKFIHSNEDYEKKLLDLLNDSLDGKFHSINAGKSVIAISMDEEAYQIFHEYQYDKGLSYTKFLDGFLESKIG